MSNKILLNPITDHVLDSISQCKDELLIAVPFISSFAKKIIIKDDLAKIKKKRIITCFDENNINSFELETLKYLIKNDVEIVFNNNIHLKLYLFDAEGIITSSNLTKNGFEDSIELTTTVELDNIEKCKSLFNRLWEQSTDNRITLELIKENYPKYLLLKKRTSYVPKKKLSLDIISDKVSSFDINKIIDFLFFSRQWSTDITNEVYKANKEKNRIKEQIFNKFKVEDFYVAKSHQFREKTIHWQIVHGEEKNISGSGLRENHFKEVSEDKSFFELMSYIYPPTIGATDWDLSKDDVFREYCNGIFNFEIPQYSETMPIRLASYFYPEYFLPIFKLYDLEQICKILGLKTDYKTKGDRLCAFNLFLREKMKSIPFNNYVKMNIAYQLYYIDKLNNDMDDGKSFDDILNKYNRKWEKNLIIKGKEIIAKISVSNKGLGDNCQ